MEASIKLMKKALEEDTYNYDDETIADIKAAIDTYEIALECNINYMYYSYYWKTEALSEIESTKYVIYLGYDTEENQTKVNDRITALKEDNYSKYIQILKTEAKKNLDNNNLTEAEYDETIYLLELKEKYGIYKEQTSLDWKEDVYNDIQTIKENLRTGINSYTNKTLTPDEIEELEDNLKIAEYRLENGIPTLDSISSERGIYDSIAPGFTMAIVAVFMIIVAGSSISTEISKGTIKFLLFTPNKRWKILLSKIISAVIILVALTVIFSLLSVLIGNIFFEDAGTIYVYISNGEVNSLSNLVYAVLYFLACDIAILVYMLFAFMLSTITRNTALSVGISIACYIGSGIIMELLNYYITADWVKYIPFNNLDIVDKIFTNTTLYTTSLSASEYLSNVSIGFSLSVLGVCSILMLVTMFDSFNKRDVV